MNPMERLWSELEACSQGGAATGKIGQPDTIIAEWDISHRDTRGQHGEVR